MSFPDFLNFLVVLIFHPVPQRCVADTKHPGSFSQADLFLPDGVCHLVKFIRYRQSGSSETGAPSLGFPDPFLLPLVRIFSFNLGDIGKNLQHQNGNKFSGNSAWGMAGVKQGEVQNNHIDPLDFREYPNLRISVAPKTISPPWSFIPEYPVWPQLFCLYVICIRDKSKNSGMSSLTSFEKAKLHANSSPKAFTHDKLFTQCKYFNIS
jgi:hypothetical protein